MIYISSRQRQSLMALRKIPSGSARNPQKFDSSCQREL